MRASALPLCAAVRSACPLCEEQHRVSPSSSVGWDDNWDMRSALKTKASHFIVLVRHGQYNTAGSQDAQHSLTDLGREQADRTGRRIRALLDGKVLPPVKYAYFSTMKRATETAEHVLLHLPADIAVEPCSMIREGAVCRPVPFPTTPWESATEENFEKDGQRVLAAFLQHVHRAAPAEESDYSTVLVCHGNVIRYLVMKSLQLPPEAWLRTAVFNSSVTLLEVRPNGRVSLRFMGDVGHLPPEMVTYM